MKLDQGQKFSEKHGADVRLDPRVKEKINQKTKKGEVACAVAFQIAEELKLSPAEIGMALDLLEVKLAKCQLGLFGYKPEKKIVAPQRPHDRDLEGALRAALVDGKLSCRSAWDIALQFNVSKMSVSAACEAFDIKIKPCQLGAF
jgi:hypothetical protein